jgi:lysozyme family protein
MADFNLALPKTLVHEGGFQNNPKDWANWIGGKPVMQQYLATHDQSLLVHLVGTKYGITAQDIGKLAAHGITAAIKDLTTDQAGVFYRAEYWNTLYNGIANQLLAEKLFDMGVLMGVQTAVRLLQISLTQGIIPVPDGIFGPITLARTNDHGNLPAYRVVLLNHAMQIVNNNPAEAGDIGGWATRINS